MTCQKFEQWCLYAAYEIRYKPDRLAVHKELRQHLDDRSEAYLAQGMSEAEAIEKTLAAMGDPKELAPQLAAIHRPFWGYAHGITRFLARMLLLLVLLLTIRATVNYLEPYLTGNKYFSNHQTDITDPRTLVMQTAPNQCVEVEGYTLTLTEAALHRNYFTNDDGETASADDLYFIMRIRKPAPWYPDLQIFPELTATDSLGNYYASANEESPNIPNSHFATFFSPKTTLFYQDRIGCIRSHIPEDAQWIDIHYNRSNYDLVWRIDLTGGGAE